MAQLDDLREDPLQTVAAGFAPGTGTGPAKLPLPGRALTWMFVTSSHRGLFRRAAQRVLGIRA